MTQVAYLCALRQLLFSLSRRRPQLGKHLKGYVQPCCVLWRTCMNFGTYRLSWVVLPRMHQRPDLSVSAARGECRGTDKLPNSLWQRRKLLARCFMSHKCKCSRLDRRQAFRDKLCSRCVLLTPDSIAGWLFRRGRGSKTPVEYLCYVADVRWRFSRRPSRWQKDVVVALSPVCLIFTVTVGSFSPRRASPTHPDR